MWKEKKKEGKATDHASSTFTLLAHLAKVGPESQALKQLRVILYN